MLPDRQVSAAAGTNLGIREAKGDVVIHLDNDVEMVTPDWAHRLVQPIGAMSNIGVVGCRIVDERGRTNHVGGVISPWRLQGVSHLHEARETGRWIDCDYVTGAVFLMARRLIDTIGGWNEAYGPVYFDDTEYCARARRNGFRVLCDTTVVARHRVSQTVRLTRSSSERSRIYHRNRLRFIRQYFRDSDLVVRALVEPFAAVQTVAYGATLGYVLALIDTVHDCRTDGQGHANLFRVGGT